MNESIARECSDLNHDEIKEIESFLTKKRRRLMQILYTRGRMSNGELAEAMGNSVASLSNMLLVFETFQYKLLHGESEGKRRYYSLTKLGREFIKTDERGDMQQNETVIFHESFLSIQKMEESLLKIQNKFGDKWEWVLDNALIYCISYGRMPINQDEDIDDYFCFVETAILNDYENGVWSVMKTVCQNAILSERMVQFLDKFEAFRPLLSAKMKGRMDELHTYEFLQQAIDPNVDREELEVYVRDLKWGEKKLNLLIRALEEIKKYTIGMNKTERCSLINKFMAGYRDLGAFLTIQMDIMYTRSI